MKVGYTNYSYKLITKYNNTHSFNISLKLYCKNEVGKMNGG